MLFFHGLPLSALFGAMGMNLWQRFAFAKSVVLIDIEPFAGSEYEMRFHGLDLNLLVAFEVLMEERSVRRSAKRLHLSQPATSSALARLRTFFGDPLLVVQGRRMYSTPYADSLLPHVRECLLSASTLIAMSSDFNPASSARVFKIATSDYILTAVIAGLTRRLANVAPNIAFEFALPAGSALAKLEVGQLDLMIAPSGYGTNTCVSVPLFEEEHVIVGCKKNPIFRHAISEEQFLAAGHVRVLIGADRVLAFADQQLALMGKARRIELTAASFVVLPWLVIGTGRLAVMHKRLADELAQYVPIAQAPLPFAFPPMKAMIQYHRSRAGDEGLTWLIGEIQEAVRSIHKIT
jgi:LysR family nod box-dependent transcriptional activator